MAQTKKIHNSSQSYCCSNPNCKRVFSQPRIIKYSVCPSCQSLAKIDGVLSQPVIEEPSNHSNSNLENLASIEVQKSKEIEALKINIADNFKEIKKLEKEKNYLNNKLQCVEQNLVTAKDKVESVSCKLKEKVMILANVTEKNLELSRRIESLETERSSDKIKIREDTYRIKGLETKISEKDDYILNIDKSIDWFREEAKNLTTQRDESITKKNEVINKLAQAEKKINQEIEARTKIQFELADIREKMANAIRKESETAEKSAKDSKRIKELENQINNSLKIEKKQIATVQTQKSINAPPIKHPINEIQEVKVKETKKEQEKSTKVQDAQTSKEKFVELTELSKAKEEDSESSGGCGFYLGYLAERDKGEAIPNSCVECSKSLDCMLSIVHKSNESVKEIKKWYHFR